MGRSILRTLEFDSPLWPLAGRFNLKLSPDWHALCWLEGTQTGVPAWLRLYSQYVKVIVDHSASRGSQHPSKQLRPCCTGGRRFPQKEGLSVRPGSRQDANEHKLTWKFAYRSYIHCSQNQGNFEKEPYCNLNHSLKGPVLKLFQHPHIPWQSIAAHKNRQTFCAAVECNLCTPRLLQPTMF